MFRFSYWILKTIETCVIIIDNTVSCWLNCLMQVLFLIIWTINSET